MSEKLTYFPVEAGSNEVQKSSVDDVLDWQDLNSLNDLFVSQGWVRVSLPDPDIVHSISSQLCKALQSYDGRYASLNALKDFHIFEPDSIEAHTKTQSHLTRLYWDQAWSFKLAQAQLPLLKGFIGPDVMVQKYPYLRIARPHMAQDNIGMHRDTHYGASPYEISMFVPFVDLTEAEAFTVVPGSHLLSEKAIPWTTRQSSDVEPGSEKHKLGFPYAPKQLPSDIIEQAVAVPCNIGEALLMSLSIVHGQEINHGLCTRFSSDIRLVNSLAPIEWSRVKHEDYYTPLSHSAVTKQAKEYHAACEADL